MNVPVKSHSRRKPYARVCEEMTLQLREELIGIELLRAVRDALAELVSEMARERGAA